MIFLKKYYINTTEGVDCIPVTHEVKYTIRDSTCQGGVATILLPEGGAGVIIAEPLPAVLDAFKQHWEALRGSSTVQEATTNDLRKREVAVWPRLMGATVGSTVQVPFSNSVLLLDPYAEIFVVDFDPVARRREVIVQIMGEPPQTAAAGPQAGTPAQAPRSKGAGHGG